jgi:hypothetical protein
MPVSAETVISRCVSRTHEDEDLAPELGQYGLAEEDIRNELREHDAEIEAAISDAEQEWNSAAAAARMAREDFDEYLARPRWRKAWGGIQRGPAAWLKCCTTGCLAWSEAVQWWFCEHEPGCGWQPHPPGPAKGTSPNAGTSPPPRQRPVATVLLPCLARHSAWLRPFAPQTTRTMRIRRAVGAAMLAGALLAGAGMMASVAVPAVASGDTMEIIQNNEWPNLVQHGYTGPAFPYTLCAWQAAGTNPRLLPCDFTQPDQTPDFTGFYAIQAAVNDGYKGPALFDLEGGYSPDYQTDNEPYWLCRAAKLARRNGIQLIEAPVWPNSTIGQTWAAAARCQAWAVELQINWATRYPLRYEGRVKYALSVIRPINSTIPVFSGLSTDPGGDPVTVSEMYNSWLDSKPLVGKYGYWLNLPVHKTGTGCAITDGCVQIALEFLHKIGAD